ncbi:MAG: PQQ-like beta-propeller repeat protein [Planctomycetes bacterium]|nr:PQQ-like beta-propeller repeat protein [Planctomycetota bacterium]
MVQCTGAEKGGKEQSKQQPFADPAKPVVYLLPEGEAPIGRRHPQVRFHSKPQSLSKEAVTHDWRSFLGPTHNGVSTETHLLKTFGRDGPKLVWELNTGQGYTSPAIFGERMVYFHRVGDLDTIECLHPETGLRYWSYTAATDYKDRYGYNNGPRSSPVIDEGRVYCFGADGRLYCLDLLTGHLYWQRSLSDEFKVTQGFFGVASTGLIVGDLLIINVGASGGPSVIGLNKKSGELVWGAGDQWGASYASPVPGVFHGQRRVLVLAGGESRPPTGGLLCINPENGQIDFRFPWRSETYESVNVSCPVVLGNKIFISSSYQTGGALLEVQDDFSYKVLWKTDSLGTHMNTPVAVGDTLYGFDGRHMQTASLVCLDTARRKEIWREVPRWQETIQRMDESVTVTRSTFRGSLLKVDGHFLCLGELGDLLWLDLSPKGYREVSRTKLFDAPETWCLPVLSRGLLYISQNTMDRTTGTGPRLLCYDLRGE